MLRVNAIFSLPSKLRIFLEDVPLRDQKGNHPRREAFIRAPHLVVSEGETAVAPGEFDPISAVGARIVLVHAEVVATHLVENQRRRCHRNDVFVIAAEIRADFVTVVVNAVQVLVEEHIKSADVCGVLIPSEYGRIFEGDVNGTATVAAELLPAEKKGSPGRVGVVDRFLCERVGIVDDVVRKPGLKPGRVPPVVIIPRLNETDDLVLTAHVNTRASNVLFIFESG